MAQVAEHVLGKDEVTGSNPVNSSKMCIRDRSSTRQTTPMSRSDHHWSSKRNLMAPHKIIE